VLFLSHGAGRPLLLLSLLAPPLVAASVVHGRPASPFYKSGRWARVGRFLRSFAFVGVIAVASRFGISMQFLLEPRSGVLPPALVMFLPPRLLPPPLASPPLDLNFPALLSTMWPLFALSFGPPVVRLRLSPRPFLRLPLENLWDFSPV